MNLKILAIVPDFPEAIAWPEPIAGLLRSGQMRLDSATTLHAAAAALVLEAPAYDALLFDADLVARRDLEMLRLFQRHTSLPVWFLPSRRGYALSPEILPPGALPADQAIRALQHSRLSDSTTHDPEGNRENFAELNPPSAEPDLQYAPHDFLINSHAQSIFPTAENKALSTAAIHSEIPLAKGLTPGYDAAGKDMVLSEPELRALLGATE